MKEPVWELEIVRMLWPRGEASWFLHSPDPTITPITHDGQYTTPWSAKRGGRRFHARYLKGTIREDGPKSTPMESNEQAMTFSFTGNT